MNYYSYNPDPNSCQIIALLPAIPTDGTAYITTDQTFDLMNFTVTIGQIDGHALTWWNPPSPKPAAVLIENIKAMQTRLDASQAESERQAAALIDLMTLVVPT